MSKLTLPPLAAGFRSSNRLNENFDAIETAIENTISRDGTAPNQMEAELDLNSNRIINLAEPNNPNDAARLADVLAISPGTGINTFLVTPTSANLAAALTDETGTGLAVFNNAPALTAPVITGGSFTGGTDIIVADGGTGASTAAGARTNLGLAIGTDVQAFDADLTAIAALTSAADKMPYSTGAQTWALADLTSFARTLLATASNSAFLVALGQIASTAIGFLSSLSGGTNRPLHNKLSDILNVRDLGCAVDGVTDDSTAFSAALTTAAAAGKSLIVPAGADMMINNDIVNAATTVSIVGEPGAVINMSGGGSLLANPGITQIANLSADITTSSATVSFVAAHNLSAGQVIVVHNTNDYSQATYRPEYHAGCMFRVATIESSTSITIYGTPTELFDKDDVIVGVMNGGSFRMKDIEIIPPASGTPIALDGYDGVKFDDVTTSTYAAGTAIEIHRCYDIAGSRTKVMADGVGSAYPFMLSNSQAIVIDGVVGNRSTRHCIAFGGKAGNFCVPTRDAIISNCIFENVTAGGIGSIEMHGGCVNIKYVNCIADHANMAGVNPSFINCVIRGRRTGVFADGSCIVGTEVVGGVYTIDGCRLESFGNGSSFGLIYFEINGRSKDWTLVGHNQIVNPNAATRGLHLEVAGSSPSALKARLEFSFDYIGLSLTQALSISGANDVSTTLSGNLNWTGPITTPLGSSVIANYSVPVSFSPVKHGVQLRGDVSVTLGARTDFSNQVWNTALTANRTITLLDDGSAAHGDQFRFVRTGGNTGGPWTLTVLGVNLAQNDVGIAMYEGGGGGVGSWIMVHKGSRV